MMPTSIAKNVSYQLPNPQQRLSLDPTPQYTLCHAFMRMTGDQLIQNQLKMMLSTQKLLDILTPAIINKNNGLDGSFCGYEKKIEHTSKNFDVSSIIQPLNECTKSRKRLSRKNTTLGNNKPWDSQSSHQELLQEIKQNCSRGAYNQVSVLLKNHKTLENKVRQLQNKERPLLNRNENLQRNKNNEHYEQNITLAAKNKKLILENQELSNKICMLQKQLEKLENMSQYSSESTQIDPITANMKNDIENKYQECAEKQSKISEVSQTLINKLTQNFIDQGCQRCCEMMKKIKESLIKYRSYMQQSLNSHDELYKKYSLMIENCHKKKQCSLP